MDWLWVIIGIAVVIFVLSKRSAKKQEQTEAQIAREFHDKRKYDKTSALQHYDNVMAKNEEPENKTAVEISISTNRHKAPPKQGVSFNDTVEAKRKEKSEDQKKVDDPLSGVLLEPIETRLYDFKPRIGKIKVQGVVTGAIFEETRQREIFYEVDLAEQTCTCRDFTKKKSDMPKNDIRRFCEHLMSEFDQRDLFERTEHRTLMVGKLGYHAATSRAYALQHLELPLMYILLEEENPWVNVYCRIKNTGETIHNASGGFSRFGYNILEKRWSYGEGATGISLLRKFFRSIKSLDDFDEICAEIANRPAKSTFSEQADPRLNPNFNSDQFGPETDWYEVPESNMVSENPCECSLLFSYVDGRGGESRRTVDFKKHQFYGMEGSYLYGECRMRKAGRTFNTKRMTDVMDVDTGELIQNVREYAENVWADSTKAKLQNWADDNDRIAKAFLYLLRGSKRGGEPDYKVLASIYSEMLGGEIVTMSDIQWLYRDKSPTTAVGFQRFVGGIIKNHPDKLVCFKESAIKLASARARPNFSDKAAIDYLNKRIP